MTPNYRRILIKLAKILFLCLIIATLLFSVSIIRKKVDVNLVSKNASASSTIDVTSLALNTGADHIHVWASGYDSNQHYQYCTICQSLGKTTKQNVQNHAFGPEQWTYGSGNARCDTRNFYRKTCPCGYSVTGRDEHTPPTNFVPTTPQRHVHYSPCAVCGLWNSSGRCRNSANQTLTCKNPGTCVDCGTVVKSSYHYVYHGKCTDCGKEFYTLSPATVSYSGNNVTVRWSATVNSGVTIKEALPITFNHDQNWSSYTSSYTRSGNKYTFTYNLVLNPSTGRSATLSFGDGVFLTYNGEDMYTGDNIPGNTVISTDRVAPTVSGVVQTNQKTGANGWATIKKLDISGTDTGGSNAVTVRVLDPNGSEVASGIASVSNNRWSISYTPPIEAKGTKVFKVQVIDMCNNTTNYNFNISNTDGKQPTVTTGTIFNTSWSKSKVINATATDSGIGGITTAFNNGERIAATLVNNVYTTTYVLTGDLYKSIDVPIVYRDNLDNVANKYVSVGYIDNTPPTVTNVQETKNNLGNDLTNATLTITANDINSTLNASGSGVKAYALTENNSKPQENDSIWQTGNTFTVNHNRTYYFWAKDAVGNISSTAKTYTVSDLTSPYKIQYYKENETLHDYVLQDESRIVDLTDKTVRIPEKTYEGYVENENWRDRKISEAINPQGTLILKRYYDRKLYDVVLNTNGGVINSGDIVHYTYGKTTILPTDLSKAGNVFVGWYDNPNLEGNPITAIGNNETGKKEFYAKWEECDASYIVRYYRQTKDLEKYEFVTVRTFAGVTGQEVYAENLGENGFELNTNHANCNAHGTVDGDGSLILNAYFKRSNYKVKYETYNGTINEQAVNGYLYGFEENLPYDVTRYGYSFGGWYDNADFEGEPKNKITEEDYGDKTYYAKWIPDTGKKYKVLHYVQEENLNGYTLMDREELEGYTDEEVQVEIKEFEGFEFDENNSRNKLTGNINPYNNLVLEAYYNRKEYNVDYVTYEGVIEGEYIEKYLFGCSEQLPSNVTKEGYKFAGWYNNEELSGNAITSISNEDSGDKTFYAKWIQTGNLEDYYIKSEKYFIEESEDRIVGNFISRISPLTTYDDFINEIETNGTIIGIKDLNGNMIDNSDNIGTGYVLMVKYYDIDLEYEIVVRGDINGDTVASLTDLSMLKQHLVNKIVLEGARAKAANINYDDKISLTDFSMLKQYIVKKIEL